MAEPREIMPILFLGRDTRFVDTSAMPPEQAAQVKQARGRDFRPHTIPADVTIEEVTEEEVPKASSATVPASGSDEEPTSTSNPESPANPADAAKVPSPGITPLL